MTIPTPCPLLERGVYRAPVLGSNGEIMLFAVDHRHAVPDHGRVYITYESEVPGASAALWRLLDAVDSDHSRRQAVRESDGPPLRRVS